MHTHDAYMRRKYFGELDGLRAVSILLVFTVHLGHPFWHSLHGGTEVSIFFVLSGYLITTLALREESKNGRISLKAFYWRRLFRIYPVYFAVLGLYCLLILGLGMQSDRKAVFLETLPFFVFSFPERPMLMRADALSVPFAGAWSLGIEEKFYLVWPLLGFVLLAWKFRARLAALALIVVGFTATTLLGDVEAILQPYALIAIGCLVAVLLNHGVWYGRLHFLGHKWVLASTSALLLVLQFSTDAILPQGSLYVVFGFVAALVLTGIVTTTTSGVRWMRWAPFVFLGQISYSFYLTHGFGINAVEMVLPIDGALQSVVSAVLSFILAVCIAWGMHVAVEKPLIRVGKHLSLRKRDAVADVAPSGFGAPNIVDHDETASSSTGK